MRKLIVFLFYVCFVTANTNPQQDLHQQNIIHTKNYENLNVLEKHMHNGIENHNVIGDVVHNVKKSIIDKQTHDTQKPQKNIKADENHQTTQNKQTASPNRAIHQEADNHNEQDQNPQHKNSTQEQLSGHPSNTQHQKSKNPYPADHSESTQHRNSNHQHGSAHHQNQSDKNIHLPNHAAQNEKTQQINTNPQYHPGHHKNAHHIKKIVGSSLPETNDINQHQKQNHRVNNKHRAAQQDKQKHNNHHHKDVHPQVHQKNRKDHSDLKVRKHHAHRKSRMAFKSFDLHEFKKYDDEADIELFENEVVQLLKDIEVGRVNATTKLVLNKYVDELFSLLRTIIMKADVNTITLPNESIKVRHSKHCKLSHGTVKDIATIQGEGDVFISYNPTEKKVTLGLPLKFSHLKVHYDYHVKSQIFKVQGGVKGLIENATFHTVLSYYYKSNRLTMDHFEMKHTGKLTVEFTGHKLVDWIINPISEALTHKFHHKIVKTLQNHMESAIRKNLVELNKNIAKKINQK